MAYGPEEGLELVDEIVATGPRRLPPDASVRGDLLAGSAGTRRPAAEFERAAELTENEPERALLLARAAECGA